MLLSQIKMSVCWPKYNKQGWKVSLLKSQNIRIFFSILLTKILRKIEYINVSCLKTTQACTFTSPRLYWFECCLMQYQFELNQLKCIKEHLFSLLLPVKTLNQHPNYTFLIKFLIEWVFSVYCHSRLYFWFIINHSSCVQSLNCS